MESMQLRSRSTSFSDACAGVPSESLRDFENVSLEALVGESRFHALSKLPWDQRYSMDYRDDGRPLVGRYGQKVFSRWDQMVELSSSSLIRELRGMIRPSYSSWLNRCIAFFGGAICSRSNPYVGQCVTSAVNAGNCLSQTPLHIAVQSNNVRAVVLLLWFGSDIDHKDIYGRVPFNYCKCSASNNSREGQYIKAVFELMYEYRNKKGHESQPSDVLFKAIAGPDLTREIVAAIYSRDSGLKF